MRLTTTFLTFATLLLCGCVRENPVGIEPDDSEVPLQFTLNMPSAAQGTRSLSLVDENEVQDVDVLAFYRDGSIYRYGYKAAFEGKVISGNQMTVTVKAWSYGVEQKFVVLVNAAAELSAANITLHEKWESALAKLVCAAGNGEWPAYNNGVGPFKAIPMYAKSDPQIVTPLTGIIGDYPLIRMVARIDVRVKPAVTNFVLTQAMLFNHKKAGYVAYEFSSFNSVIESATVAAVPAAGDHSGDPIVEPTVVYGASLAGEIIRSIYTYESPAYNSANRLKGTALVVGGKYNGSATVTYYRVNLLTTDDLSPTHISSHILRNHRYDVEIQNVDGPGEGTPMEAYMGSSKIIVKVLEWNNALLNFEIPNQYNLMVSTDRLDLPNVGGSQTLKLITDYPDGWEIGTKPSWIIVTPSLGATNDPAGIMLTVTAAPNTTIASREDFFVITAGNMSKKVHVTQDVDLGSIIGGGTLITTNTYTGAFWKANQTGERVIRITGIAAANSGAWMAKVAWYDGRWSPLTGDGILLAAGGSSDPGVTYNTATENPGDAESWQVTNGSSSVGGTISSSGGSIIFRIGLQQKFSDTGKYKADDPVNSANDANYTTTWPARYAVVLIYFNNYTKVQKIFIRQGEGSDFVMRPQDGIYTGGMNNPDGPGARPAANRFTPYNLTAPSGSWASANGVQLGVQSGVFTKFPTTVGAHIQWANGGTSSNDRVRFAWNSYTNTTLSPTWNSTNAAGYWSTLAAQHETCPVGYRRPNDGPITTNSNGDVIGSEMRQSLFEKPETGATIMASMYENSCKGCYADGFLDRYGFYGNVVSQNTEDRAAVGRLFFNPTTNASLFFPGEHYRNGNNGNITSVSAGYYWTSSASSTTMAWFLSAGGGVYMNNSSSYNKNYAFSIRCVRQ